MSLKKIYSLIDKAEVVSFDVFDNVIIRKLLHPVDVFVLLEQEEGFDFDFKTVREMSEWHVRCKYWEKRSHEITLDQIYSHIGEILDLNKKQTTELKNKEIEIEKKVCIKNPYMYKAYQYALEQGKKVVFYSDMYLPQKTVQEILEKNGYKKFEKLYVSSETLKPKHNGKAFELLIKDLKTKPNKILHIGDNVHSDYKMPKKYGLKAYRYKTPKETAFEDKYFQKFLSSFKYYELENPLISSWAAAIVNEFFTEELKPKRDFFERFGFYYAAPLLLGFTRWVMEDAKKQKVEKLFFQSRDGYIVNKIYKEITKNDKNALPGDYIYVSRRVFRIPAITKLDDKILAQLTETFKRTPLKTYFDRIGLDINNYRNVIKKYGFTKRRKVVKYHEIPKVKEIFKEIKNDILKKAKEERNLLHRYLEKNDLFKYKNIAFTDVGWAGTSQKSYEKTIKKLWNIKQNVIGYYLATEHLINVKNRNDDITNMKSYTTHFGKPRYIYKGIMTRCLEIIEFMMYAPHGSVLGYKEKNGEVIPVLDSKVPIFNVQSAEKMQTGILNFVKSYNSFLNDFKSVKMETKEIFKPIERLMNHPTTEEAKHLGKIEHSSGMGSYLSTHQIANPPSIFKIMLQPIAFIKDLQYSYWKIGYLKQLPFLRHFGFYKLRDYILRHPKLKKIILRIAK